MRLPGLGTFVSEQPRVDGSLDGLKVQTFEEHVQGHGHRVTYRLLGFERVPVPRKAAQTLGLGKGALVHRLERLRFVNQRLVGFEERFIPSHYGNQITRADLHDLNVLTIVARTSAGPVREISVVVRAAAATQTLANRLDIGPGEPVLVRDHHYIGQSGDPVLCGSIAYRSDRYQFSYVLQGSTDDSNNDRGNAAPAPAGESEPL